MSYLLLLRFPKTNEMDKKECHIKNNKNIFADKLLMKFNVIWLNNCDTSNTFCFDNSFDVVVIVVVILAEMQFCCDFVVINLSLF